MNFFLNPEIPMPTRNIKLTISYDGGSYHGWQVQPDRITVQEVIENAILQITGEPSRLASAGRTDTGVHAIGQVASLKTNSTIPAERFRPAIQSQLPDDVVIRDSCEVPDDFHAGYAARWKLYRYLILNSEIPHPHLNRFTTRIAAKLDATKMNQAAQSLVGEHDFRSFESHYPNKATSVRHVKYCSVQQGTSWSAWQPSIEGNPILDNNLSIISLDIVANGFLYNMVRAITGTLLKIGSGDWPVDAAKRVLEAMDRKQAGPTAPPQGLYLMHVEYERDFDTVEFL